MFSVGVGYVWAKSLNGGWSLQCVLIPADFEYTGYYSNGYKYFGMDAVSISGNVIAIGNMDNRRSYSDVYDGN